MLVPKVRPCPLVQTVPPKVAASSRRVPFRIAMEPEVMAAVAFPDNTKVPGPCLTNWPVVDPLKVPGMVRVVPTGVLKPGFLAPVLTKLRPVSVTAETPGCTWMVEFPMVSSPAAAPRERSASITSVELSPIVVFPTKVLSTPPFALVSQLREPMPAPPCV